MRTSPRFLTGGKLAFAALAFAILGAMPSGPCAAAGGDPFEPPADRPVGPLGPPAAGAQAIPSQNSAWRFAEVADPAGVFYVHGLSVPPYREAPRIAGGVAAGDYDGDGLVDLYAVRGDIGPNLLFHNDGNGRFTEVGHAAGVDLENTIGSGPTFADVNGDGRLDLLVGGVAGTQVRLFLNRGDGAFVDATADSGLTSAPDAYSAAFADYDRDGDLDLYLTHWIAEGGRGGYLWRNDGAGHFADVSASAGLIIPGCLDFTPNFADIDADGWPDLLLAADFGTSRVLRNAGDGTFVDITTSAISDENGMGATVGDYDNDGDLDWFVSSIHDADGTAEGNWGITGNRLYSNRGDGTFDDVTGSAGVREGFWGWGSCFADFDNDGHLDLFQVNGFSAAEAAQFHEDPARLFLANGDGAFTEQALARGIADTGGGRGVVCFDYDRDGDVDVFIANNQGPSRLYRNDGGNSGHYLGIVLKGAPPNTQAIGARILVRAGGTTQLRELRAGSNFASQDPAEAHFGLGRHRTAAVTVLWPDGSKTTLKRRRADQVLEIVHP